MINRFLEVVSMALLFVLVISATFQVLNYQLLREIKEKLEEQENRPVVVQAPGQDIRGQAPAGERDSPPPVVVKEEVKRVEKPVADPVVTKSEPIAVEQKPQVPEAVDPEPELVVSPEPVKPEGVESVSAVKDSPLWKEYGGTVVESIDLLLAGEYEKLERRFEREFAQTMTVERMRASMASIRERYGELGFGARGEPVEIEKLDEGEYIFRYALPVEGKGKLTFSVAVNGDKQITGLLVR